MNAMNHDLANGGVMKTKFRQLRGTEGLLLYSMPVKKRINPNVCPISGLPEQVHV